MALRPEISLAGALATGGLVYAIYSRNLPPNADLRVGDPGDPDAESERKQALWSSIGVVGAISLLAKDPTIFVVGSAMTIGLDWSTRHAIWVDPSTGSAALPRADDQMIPTQADAPDEYGPQTLRAV
jgi:hypothetical protein